MTFPPVPSDAFNDKVILARERALGLHDLGIVGSYVVRRKLVRWQAHYTCESYSDPTVH